MSCTAGTVCEAVRPSTNWFNSENLFLFPLRISIGKGTGNVCVRGSKVEHATNIRGKMAAFCVVPGSVVGLCHGYVGLCTKLSTVYACVRRSQC